MKKISWETTRETFIDWLSKNELKKEFAKELCYYDLSLWWLTNLYEKDNVNDTKWFDDLNELLTKKKIPKNNNIGFILYFLKLTKKLLSSIFFNLFIKIFYSEKILFKKNKKDCVYALFSNLIEHKNYYIDRQYGLYGLKNKSSIVYFIDIAENFDLIKNYSKNKKKLSKIPFEYFLSAKNVKIIDIFKIYFFCLRKFLKTIFILRKKNFFYIKNKDASSILKQKVIKSFFGSIQDQLIKGIALNNSLKKKNFKNFINCFDFHPQSRCIYYFAKKSKIKNVININHANYSENDIFFNFKKNEFSNNNLDCKLFSPYPDIFFCQGNKYFEKLKKIFKNKKIFKIGSLKIELNKSRLNLKKIPNSTKNKKVIVILCSINDYQSFIKILNNCDLENFKIVVAPHPLKKEITALEFKRNFKKKFIIDKNRNKTKLLNSCDYIIFGDTSLGLELSIMGKNVFRVYDQKFIPTFDLDNEIPTATNFREVQNFLGKRIIRQNQNLIEKNFFYKYDKKASQRFASITKKF